MKLSTFCAVGLALAALAGSSEAQTATKNPMLSTCAHRAYCAYDTGNHILGIYDQQNILTRQISEQSYNIGYTSFGLESDMSTYYTSRDCTGQPFAITDRGGSFAMWDGASFWGATGPISTIMVQSSLNECQGLYCEHPPAGQCQTSAPYAADLAPIGVVETPTLTSPNAACMADQNCVRFMTRGTKNRMPTICALGALCAYDTGGNILGVYQSVGDNDPLGGDLARQIGQNLYTVNYDTSGLLVDLWLYYASSDCTGQPLISDGFEDGQPVPFDPPFVMWDGTSFWGPVGLVSTMTIQSVATGPGQCQSVGSYTSAFAPAAVIETPTLTPPTPACIAAQNCVTIR